MANVQDERKPNTPTATNQPNRQETPRTQAAHDTLPDPRSQGRSEEARDTSQGVGTQVRDKAQEVGTQIRDTAQEVGTQIREKPRKWGLKRSRRSVSTMSRAVRACVK